MSSAVKFLPGAIPFRWDAKRSVPLVAAEPALVCELLAKEVGGENVSMFMLVGQSLLPTVPYMICQSEACIRQIAANRRT